MMLRIGLIIVLLLGVAACGQKGPLFKPDADEPERESLVGRAPDLSSMTHRP